MRHGLQEMERLRMGRNPEPQAQREASCIEEHMGQVITWLVVNTKSARSVRNGTTNWLAYSMSARSEIVTIKNCSGSGTGNGQRRSYASPVSIVSADGLMSIATEPQRTTVNLQVN